jgi:DNA-binding FadR family transcriptional regulator
VKASITIAGQIRTRIARAELLPGDPLPVEDELTAEFGCSRPVVREALRILETEGFVEVRRGLGGGARIRHPSISDAAKTVGIHLQIGDVAVLDVWTARDRIVAAAVERLALEAGDVDLQPLAEEVEALRNSIGDFAHFNDHVLAAGEAAVALAGNRTEDVLVGALRHIVAVEVAAATRRVTDAQARRLARRVQTEIVRDWSHVLEHIQARNAPAARAACERQAGAVRDRIGMWIAGVTVGDAAASAPG